MRLRRRLGLWLFLSLVAGGALFERTACAESGDDLHVFVLTFGPGDHPFFKFGHNAILIRRDGARGLVFNYGTFAFDSPALIPKFLKGRLNYWLSVSGEDDTLMTYQESNRSIEAQELDLTGAQKQDMLARLRQNARPDKREYLYDYFWDNCSTRVRDMVDVVVGGRVRAVAGAPAEQTLRAHALRMTADWMPEYVGLALGLGSLTDQALTVWQEAFLPERLQALLRRVTVSGPAGERPLVRSERVIFQAARPPKPDRPPDWAPMFALVGILTGGGLFLLGLGSRRWSAARVTIGVVSAILGLVLGLLGIILVLLWVATDHRAAHANENILQLAPWALALVVVGVQVALGRDPAARRAATLAVAAAGLSTLGVFAKVLATFRQDNWAFILLMLPVWLGLAGGLAMVQRAQRSRR